MILTTLILSLLTLCIALVGNYKDVVKQRRYWTYYYLLVPYWMTHDEFTAWVEQSVVVYGELIPRWYVIKCVPEIGEVWIAQLVEAIQSNEALRVYELVQPT